MPAARAAAGYGGEKGETSPIKSKKCLISAKSRNARYDVSIQKEQSTLLLLNYPNKIVNSMRYLPSMPRAMYKQNPQKKMVAFKNG